MAHDLSRRTTDPIVMGPHFPANRDLYRLDWSAPLELDDDGDPTGDSISAAVWTIPASSGLVKESESIEGSFRTVIELSGGVEGDHDITCKVTSVNGRILHRLMRLPVRRF